MKLLYLPKLRRKEILILNENVREPRGTSVKAITLLLSMAAMFANKRREKRGTRIYKAADRARAQCMSRGKTESRSHTADEI